MITHLFPQSTEFNIVSILLGNSKFNEALVSLSHRWLRRRGFGPWIHSPLVAQLISFSFISLTFTNITFRFILFLLPFLILVRSLITFITALNPLYCLDLFFISPLLNIFCALPAIFPKYVRSFTTLTVFNVPDFVFVCFPVVSHAGLTEGSKKFKTITIVCIPKNLKRQMTN